LALSVDFSASLAYNYFDINKTDKDMADYKNNCKMRDKRKAHDNLILDVAGIGGAIAFSIVLASTQTLFGAL